MTLLNRDRSGDRSETSVFNSTKGDSVVRKVQFTTANQLRVTPVCTGIVYDHSEFINSVLFYQFTSLTFRLIYIWIIFIEHIEYE